MLRVGNQIKAIKSNTLVFPALVGSMTMVKFSNQLVPEPSTLALLGLGAWVFVSRFTFSKQIMNCKNSNQQKGVRSWFCLLMPFTPAFLSATDIADCLRNSPCPSSTAPQFTSRSPTSPPATAPQSSPCQCQPCSLRQVAFPPLWRF